MRSFFKIFFAALLALIVFVVISIFFFAGWIAGIASSSKVEGTGSNAVLVLDLNQTYNERVEANPLSVLDDDHYDAPGVYDLVRLLHYAKGDSAIKGIYLKSSGNPNGFGTSEEIRNALIDFKKSGKFILAYADIIPTKAYYVASVADNIYCNPKGGVEWKGFTYILPFMKGTLDKLGIQPEIFYAGKFKSATEPLRADKMSDANRLQMSTLLNDIYNHMLYNTAAARNLDTNTLRQCVDQQLIRFAGDAVKYKLVDGLKYDDEIRAEIARKLKLDAGESLNFVPVGKYAVSVKNNFKTSGSDRIALIYAEGDIVGGKNDQQTIGEEAYRTIIRKARMDKNIKAIVLRINSGGGDGGVSENLWRELTLAKQVKPVVVSFGDVSASGAYYLSCNADSIFAEPDCITGSIGVFTYIFNVQPFLKDKLGVTFDGLRTAKQPDALSMVQPLSDMQKQYLQSSVDSFYISFKTRVSDGRKKQIGYIDSIAQGRVWSGERALQLGLIDRIGSIQDAIDCAARLAKTKDYSLKEYPEEKGLFEQILSNYKRSTKLKIMKEDLGDEGVKLYNSLSDTKSWMGAMQARMPFGMVIE